MRDQSSPPDPIKRRAECQESREWSSVGSSLGEESVAVSLGPPWSSSERAEETGAWSAASLPYRAELRAGGETAGERLPPSEITVRGDRASGRSEQMRRNGRALKRASTLKDQKPIRSSGSSSARPKSPGRTAGPGPTKSRGATCRVDGTSRVAQRVTMKVAGNQHGLSEFLRSPQLCELLKAHEVQFYPFLSWGFSLHEYCGAVSVKS